MTSVPSQARLIGRTKKDISWQDSLLWSFEDHAPDPICTLQPSLIKHEHNKSHPCCAAWKVRQHIIQQGNHLQTKHANVHDQSGTACDDLQVHFNNSNRAMCRATCKQDKSTSCNVSLHAHVCIMMASGNEEWQGKALVSVKQLSRKRDLKGHI